MGRAARRYVARTPARRGRGDARRASSSRSSSAIALARSWSPARTASASTVARLATACVRSCPRASCSDSGSPSVTGGSSRTGAGHQNTHGVLPPSLATVPVVLVGALQNRGLPARIELDDQPLFTPTGHLRGAQGSVTYALGIDACWLPIESVSRRPPRRRR